MPVKYVNGSFFEGEGKAPDELKAMWYILGVSFAQYSSQLRYYGQPMNRWQSTSKPLIEIVKSALDSEHSIVKVKNRHIRGEEDFLTYWLDIQNQRIYDALSERGLNVPKSERAFPEVEERYLYHFVRGFFDAHVSCHTITTQSSKYNPHDVYLQELKVWFNAEFLRGLYNALVKYVGVADGSKIIKSPLRFGTRDTRKIYHLIYRDQDFVQESGLYLPVKKELFDEVSDNDLLRGPDHSHIPDKVNVQMRIARAKELLPNISVGEVALRLGYQYPPSFSRAFKTATGKTPTEFVRENAQLTSN